jgi:hypothetical protein
VHYSTVAERLGIGKVTAYEMLRLLEERGLIRAEYQSNPKQRGPGRSAVHFLPTPEAHQLMGVLSGESTDFKNWLIVKEQILQQLRDGRAGGYDDLLSNIFARINERRSPLIFVTELTTAVILMLTNVQETPEIRALLQRLEQIGLPQKVSLSVLSGIALLLSALERTNQHYSKLILTHVNRFEDTLSELSEESRQYVSEFTREAVHILSS